MQTARRLADQLVQTRFDVHVNVFIGIAEREGAVLDLAFDHIQTAKDGVGVGLLDDALLGQHAAMCARSGKVLGPKAFVHADRHVNSLHDVCGFGAEAATPHRLALRLGGRRIGHGRL